MLDQGNGGVNKIGKMMMSACNIAVTDKLQNKAVYARDNEASKKSINMAVRIVKGEQ